MTADHRVRGLIPVAFTWYPEREPEQTVRTLMPQVPAVNDSVALDDADLPIMRVRHVRWVEERGPAGAVWAAEISLGH